MSRSIHDTWGEAARVRKEDWSDPELQRATVAELKQNWLHQQAIRESERRLRRGGDLPPQPVNADQVPIFVDDEAPYLVHPADEDDIRAILRRLPPGSLDGLQAIRLCVDHKEARGEATVRDPYTGRLRHEVIPGVYSSSTAGYYDRSIATIRLFGCLCDPATLGPFALLLKMDALRTLVHEVAHHFDNTFRKKRNRWDVRDKNEMWAERIEGEQAAEIVAPYVAERYSMECKELRSWTKEHGGAALSPLVFLDNDDDDESTSRRALMTLVRSVRTGGDRDEMGIAFARDLHLSGDNDEARRAVERVLSRRPDAAEALAVSACITQCMDRDHKAAEALCQRAIASDPACLEAWKVLARGQAIQKKWQGAAQACERALALVPAATKGTWYLVETLAESHRQLGDLEGLESDVGRMRAWGTEYSAESAEVHLTLARCWSERWEEALTLATRLISTVEYETYRRWLAAVQFECAHRLGRPDRAGAFDRAGMVALEGEEFAFAWVIRIREHIEVEALWPT
jgi:tetratricopeptide (TPR) repeat protein